MKVRRGSKRNEFSRQLCRSMIRKQQLSGSSSVGRTLVLGTRGRRFESCLPDHMAWWTNGKVAPKDLGRCVI